MQQGAPQDEEVTIFRSGATLQVANRPSMSADSVRNTIGDLGMHHTLTGVDGVREDSLSRPDRSGSLTHIDSFRRASLPREAQRGSVLMARPSNVFNPMPSSPSKFGGRQSTYAHHKRYSMQEVGSASTDDVDSMYPSKEKMKLINIASLERPETTRDYKGQLRRWPGVLLMCVLISTAVHSAWDADHNVPHAPCSAHAIPFGLWENDQNGTTVYEVAAFLHRNKFNSIRLPLAAESILKNTAPNKRLINLDANRAVNVKGYMELLKSILKALAFRDITVMLSMHTLTTKGASGSWFNKEFAEEDFLKAIDVLANELCTDEYWNVIGIDLKNEPNDCGWGPLDKASAKCDWVAGAKLIGDRMHAGCKNWLAFVEGSASTSHTVGKLTYFDWWGGRLQDADTVPVTLKAENKLVWAPHYYSTAVAPQPYFYDAVVGSASGNGYSSYKELSDEALKSNIHITMEHMFGYLREQRKHAIVIGEFGGLYTKDEHEQFTIRRTVDFTIQEMQLDGYSGGYMWSLNPESGYDFPHAGKKAFTSEGLLLDDWLTPNKLFMEAMGKLNTLPNLKPFPCFSPYPPSINNTLTCDQLRAALNGSLAALTFAGFCSDAMATEKGASSQSPTPTSAPQDSSNIPVVVGVGGGSFVLGCLVVFFIYRHQASKLRSRLAVELVFGDRKSDVDRFPSRRSGGGGAHTLSSRTPFGSSYNRMGRRSGLFQPNRADEIDEVVGFQLDMGDLDLWRMDENDLTSHELLAKGAHGEVWVGDYRGMLVAIKKNSNAGKTAKDVQKFIDEIKLFTKLDSPYITKFIGVSWMRPREIELVMEFMDRGDLRKYLESTKQEPVAATATIHAMAPPLFPWSDKIGIMRDVIEGLSYLHSVDIIHRDLKSRNVLLTEQLNAKLSDFGISKEITNDTMTQGVGTYRWTAPELIAGERYTVAADIYSFGVLISELDTHDIPYADYRNEKNQPLNDFQIMALVRQGSIQPHFTHGCPDWVYDLALRCISLQPELRPTGPELSHILRQQLKRAQQQAVQPAASYFV
ncbi:hypothetical protein DYB32_006760 [Aphanomyces invadans]|uniref:Protein kinase domain-containing protein n=1 Tax=Aphanomyces invadans TaxID=157072 RepID=A0A3R6VJ07_9STRA|nr:hypothetical protein DYB32_006760 [Aphanomyces invadans]